MDLIMNCDNNDNSIWFELHVIKHLLHRQVNQRVKLSGIDDMTLMHSYIIHFLFSNQDIDVYQKDLEKNFHLTRSSITNIMQNLEKNGYIKRESVQSDARLKKITLTPQGLELHNKISTSMQDTEEYVHSLLTPDEFSTFLSVCRKLRFSLEEEQYK